MVHPRELFRHRRAFFATVFSLVLLVTVSASTWLSRTRRPQNNVPLQRTSQVTIKTQALEVLDSRVAGNRIKLTLRNKSNKNINGFQLAVGHSQVQIEFLDADEPERQLLLPGATYEEWFTLEPDPEPLNIAILAVVFDDRSSDGDPRMIKEIVGTRLGQQMQLKHLRPLYLASIVSPKGNTSEALSQLEAEILAAPEDWSKDLSGNVKLGLQNEKQRILWEIRSLRHTQQTRGGVQVKQATTNLLEKIDKKLARL